MSINNAVFICKKKRKKMNSNLSFFMILITIVNIVSSDNECLNLSDWKNFKLNFTIYLGELFNVYQIQINNKRHENFA